MPRRKKQSTAPQQPPIIGPSPVNPATKRLLWLLVGSFTLVILLLWGWATKIQLSSISWSKTPEKRILETSRNEWNELFNNEETKIKNEQLKKELKNMIAQFVAEMNTTTTSTIISTTSTPVAPTSTATTSSTTTTSTTN